MIARFWRRALVAVAIGAPATASSQSTLADSIPTPGSIKEAESAPYEAVRIRPRDPDARLALGRYLLARGAVRVGVTLLEESLRFGADTNKVEPDLARGYLDGGDYRSLAALKSAAAGQRQRARWLLDHESRTIAPDSLIAVRYQLPSDGETQGRVTIRLNGKPVEAAISSSATGILVDDSVAQLTHLLRFPGDADRGMVLGAADSIGIGELSITNVPVTILRADNVRPVTIGLDVLGQFVVTFDPAQRTAMLHISNVVILPLRTRFATWRATSELQLLQSNGWTSVTRPSIARLLRTHRWTFDSKRGVLVIEP